jgi:hypothetical protein
MSVLMDFSSTVAIKTSPQPLQSSLISTTLLATKVMLICKPDVGTLFISSCGCSIKLPTFLAYSNRNLLPNNFRTPKYETKVSLGLFPS